MEIMDIVTETWYTTYFSIDPSSRVLQLMKIYNDGGSLDFQRSTVIKNQTITSNPGKYDPYSQQFSKDIVNMLTLLNNCITSANIYIF